MARMTAKQQLFCDEYLIDLNATQAAIRAGYSEKYAHTNAAKLLRITTIKEYIEKRMEEKQSELIAKQDEVLQYLTAVMRGESQAEIVVVEGVSARAMQKAPDEKERMKAAELLGKYYGAWNNKAALDLEEQRARIDKIKAEIDRITGDDSDPREDKIMKLFEAIGGALDESK